MRALKKIASVPVAVALCVAALWGICAISVATLYPTASQSTSAYRLASFSGNALAFVNKLQQERAAAAAYLATHGTAKSAIRLNKSANRFKKNMNGTDRRHEMFRKSVGRFNSDDYGTELTAALREADALFAGLGSIRTRILDSAVSAEDAIAYYTKIISMVSKSIFLLETQPLGDAASDRSRKAYVSLVRAAELSSQDMADGLTFLGSRNKGREPGESRPQVSEAEQGLLSKYQSLATAEPLALFEAWSQSEAKSATDEMRKNMARESNEASASRTYTVGEWFRVFRGSLVGLFKIELAQQQSFVKKVSDDAARAAYLFVTLTFGAGLATLVAVTWFRPAYFRHGLLALLIFGNIALIAWATTVGADWLVKESGPIESLQAVALAAAFFIFCANTANTKGAARVAAIIFTCACFLLFFREFDFRVYGAPEWLVTASSGTGRRILFVAIIAVLTVYVATQWRLFTAMVRPFLKWDAWPLLLWLPLLLTGELIEVVTHNTRKDASFGYWGNGQFWEELFELDAYLVLLFGAYVFAEIFGLRTKQESLSRLESCKHAFAARKS